MAFLVLLGTHGVHTFYFFSGADIWRSPLPILVHDHAYVAYNAKVAARALSDSATTAAYDPHYMGGYVNSFVSSSNAFLPFVVRCAGESNWGVAYKCYGFAAVALMPLLVLFSSRLFGWTQAHATLSAAFWVLAFWGSGKSWRYVDYGMVAFLTSTSWLLLTGAAASRFFDCATFSRALALGLTAGVACLWHTTIPVLLAPGCITLLLRFGSGLSQIARWRLAFSVGVCLAINGPWLLTIPTVWQTLGSTPKFFVNPNVLERLGDIFKNNDESVTIPFLAAMGGLPIFISRLARPARTFLFVSMAWTAFLSYPAGWLRSLDVLQPGRNTVALTALLCLPAGGLFSGLLRRRTWPIGLLASIGVGFYGWTQLPAAVVNYRNVVSSVTFRMPSRLPAFYRTVIADIRANFQGSRRIFYEDCNSGVPSAGNPFYTFRPTPLLAEMTGIEFIGGPYLRTHYVTQNAQVGDGKFFGKPTWSLEDFTRHVEAYDVSGIVCWSPQLKKFCLSQPKHFVERFRWGDQISGSEILGFAIVRERPNPLPDGVSVSADIDRISVTSLRPPKAAFVIPYHWQSGLRAQAGIAIRPRKLDGIALPFIEVEPFEGEAVIHFDALSGWKKQGTSVP